MPSTETPEDRRKRERLEAECRELGTVMMPYMPRGTGFTLVLYDFGSGGNMAYISNGNREDCLAMLRELLGKIDPQKEGGELKRLQAIVDAVPLMLSDQNYWTADELHAAWERTYEVVSCRAAPGPCTCGAHVSEVMSPKDCKP
jgi:hypothetical protein